MNVIVTCGPSYEPIDGARRLTNMSTGALGVRLSNFLTELGHDVRCFKGETASTQVPLATSHVESFSTNDDLLDRLHEVPDPESTECVFHAAALCDFRVDSVKDKTGGDLRAPKIGTRHSGVTLNLTPTTKLLPLLGNIFPNARIVGWKYELNGTRDDAFSRARGQLEECGSFACVLNGAAYGPGYAVCRPDHPPVECPDSEALFRALSDLLDH